MHNIYNGGGNGFVALLLSVCLLHLLFYRILQSKIHNNGKVNTTPSSVKHTSHSVLSSASTPRSSYISTTESNRNTPTSLETDNERRSLDVALFKIVESIETIKAVQSQQSIQIDQILRTVSNKNIMDVSAEAPDDFPNFPLQKKSQFRSLELFLQKGESYNYMVGKRNFN